MTCTLARAATFVMAHLLRRAGSACRALEGLSAFRRLRVQPWEPSLGPSEKHC